MVEVTEKQCYDARFAGFMIKCQSQGGWFPWEAVPMEEATTTIHTQLCVVAIALFQLIFMFLGAPQQLKLFYMACFSFRRRSIDAKTLHCGGTNEFLGY